ncbi:type II toxin-antitoxin system HipA family toxin [Lysobacter firmicutimachus]|uniref:Type II toxin-antitoxin system HipA family toxin n=1 Tax=Lysobacter firmicutimachus TaxID=1792846 RepID=A0ABU8D9T8_9GAMM
MELWTLLNGQHIGTVWTDRAGGLHFRYESAWRDSPEAIPLSLCLPFSFESFDQERISAVLWGLLPDNAHTLQRWAQAYQVSASNPVALLAHVGEDCAGALQFIKPERLQDLLEGKMDGQEPLDEADIADRLRRLRQDSGASRRPDDVGQFSLAGAQPKIALLEEDARWYVPSGRIPTTHILKPPSGDFDGFAENEHFCLRLAAELGMNSARTQVVRFGNEKAICVERYDRDRREDGAWQRIHQEDFCQALATPPQRKYQNQGGPSPKSMAALLRLHSSDAREDVEQLFLALGFNWMIAGTDAHAKNYSLLLGERGAIRLAPLYDISSVLPYKKRLQRKINLAMKIGNHYRWWDVNINDWISLSSELSLEPGFVVDVLKGMASQLPDLALTEARRMREDGLDHPILPRLTDEIQKSCLRASRLLSLPSRVRAKGEAPVA